MKEFKRYCKTPTLKNDPELIRQYLFSLIHSFTHSNIFL